VLTRVGLPYEPETLRYSGSCEFSWFFRIGKLVACTSGGGIGGAKEGYAVGLTGKKEGRGAGRSRKLFNYAIGAGMQDTRCAKKRPATNGEALYIDSARSGWRERSAWLDPQDHCGHWPGSCLDMHHTPPAASLAPAMAP